MLNQDLVRARALEITGSVARLRAIAALPLSGFLADQDTLDIACYRLQVAIEAALQLCYHVCAKELRQVPEEYAQCFSLLDAAGIIPAELSENLQKAARFRNLLVHLYWKIEYRLVHEVLQGSLDDLEAFARHIVSLE
ncbi:MAG: type VII toxin-antitoxin system HepT family RNase toxin [Thermodesulfobacteriota bacterium]